MCKRVEEGISFSLARGKEKEWRGIRYNRKEIYVDGKVSMFEVENFEVRNRRIVGRVVLFVCFVGLICLR